nr:hypothetical protein [Angustibacter aerolatus]
MSTSRAWAWLAGRDFVTPDDVKALVRPTLRHRVALRPEAEPGGRHRRRRARRRAGLRRGAAVSRPGSTSRRARRGPWR